MLQQITLGDTIYDSYGTNTAGALMNFVLMPEEVQPDNLFRCDNTSTVTADCTYRYADNSTTYVYSTSMSVALSNTTSFCINDSGNGISLNTDNYTITWINETYLGMDFVSGADGVIQVKWLPQDFNTSHWYNNLKCTNATVSGSYWNVTEGYEWLDITVNGSTAARTMICSIDTSMTPTAPTSIPVAVLFTLTAIAIAARVGASSVREE